MVKSSHIHNKLSQVPHKPGIYLMKDRLGTVIYVGKARDLRRRVSQYFHPSRRLGWDLKLKALIDAIQDFDFHVVRTEAEALLLEGKLIKEFHPRYNISFRDDKRFLLVKVNLNDPIPHFTLTRLKQDDRSLYFGPFVHSVAARKTLGLARRQFHLRGCRSLTPTEADYKHCLYAHLKFCTAPCIGNVSAGQYREQVRAACEFLSGQAPEIEEELAKEMKKAAAAQEFERAAQLRDALQDLRQTTARNKTFERIPYTLPLAVDPERDLGELASVLGLAHQPERIEGFDISNISGTFAVASMVRFLRGRPDRSQYRRYRIKSVEGQNDVACMAEIIRRRYRRLLQEANQARDVSAQPRAVCVRQQPEMESKPHAPEPDSECASAWPDLIVIDGGRGQLNAACQELIQLGLAHVPIIGLAKEFEEIYRPQSTEPLRLAETSGALKLLQRVRDESHRFANAFNAQLRLRKISESILDEFPGIGDRRKAALLRKFGSVHRLRLATEEQIAEVPGFGGKIAGELKAFLLARYAPSQAADRQ